jgi:3',5'-cyclic AMP phosphodiesterase CpdA
MEISALVKCAYPVMKNTSLLFCFLTSLLMVNAQPMPSSSNDSTLIAFASDTQAPMWVETLWLKATGNRKATKTLFGDITRVRPRALFLLGDVVNLGYSNRQWKPMDGYLDTLRHGGVSVYAILGNHEVMGQPKKGQQKFQKRFPEHVNTGYVQVIDSVAIVLLNSNFGNLTPKENAKQLEWYDNTLKELDADSAIQYIITGCHHSPFTNSKIVSGSATVQQQFVPLFLRSAKSRLFLSGHSHNFEHFQVGGKDFLVIGGGGGLHQPLRQGAGILPDLAKDYKPLFHYLTLKRRPDRLHITSYQIKSTFDGFEEGKTIEIFRTPAEALAGSKPVGF